MWRVFLWTLLLWRVSRLNLFLVATHADEAGRAFWLSGADSSFAALAPQTGLTTQIFVYDGSEGGNTSFQHGTVLAAGAPDSVRSNPAVREAYLGEAI